MICEGCRSRECVIADLTAEAKELRAQLAAEVKKREEAERVRSCISCIFVQQVIVLKERAEALAAENVRLSLELAAAREALEPFALAADCATCPGTIPPEKVVLWCQSSTTLGPKGEITVADVRRAKMFLSSFSPSAVSNIEAVLKSAK
jgi:hypothetical protein